MGLFTSLTKLIFAALLVSVVYGAAVDPEFANELFAALSAPSQAEGVDTPCDTTPKGDYPGYGPGYKPGIHRARQELDRLAPDPFEDMVPFDGRPRPGESQSFFDARAEFNRLYAKTMKKIDDENRKDRPDMQGIGDLLGKMQRAKRDYDAIKYSAQNSYHR